VQSVSGNDAVRAKDRGQYNCRNHNPFHGLPVHGLPPALFQKQDNRQNVLLSMSLKTLGVYREASVTPKAKLSAPAAKSAASI
jgi:hypothetical protein